MRFAPGASSDQEDISLYKRRLGIRMCLLYTVVYAVFVTMNTFCPALMDLTFGGLNLAILSGFALIVFAFALACLYNHFCSSAERRSRR